MRRTNLAKWHIMVLAGLLVTACMTPEYRAQRQICEAKWLRKIPPNYVQELYNKTYIREVPTGVETCETADNVTTCTKEMQDEYYSLPAVREVDANKERRDIKIDACANSACLDRYGNSSCKTGR